ncbi:MAG: GntR family transcriptional regulator [Verrucomicrobiae bacterium]|nr:GntR family transcriptional regulator [Verrucomicrobiae bacterium]
MNLEFDIQRVEPAHVQIERFVRHCIQTGQLNVMDQLPTTDELAQKWRIDRKEVQKAMAHLAAEGFVERRRKRGTFVKSANERAVLGVMIGPSLTEEDAYLYRAILKFIRLELMETKGEDWLCHVYDGLIELKTREDYENSAVYRHFSNDLKNYSFRGVIDLYGGLKEEEILRLPSGLPLVRAGSHPKKSDVLLDTFDFGRQCVSFIAEKGLKKIIYVRTEKNLSHHVWDLDGIEDRVRALNLPPIEICQMQGGWLNGGQLESVTYEKTLQMIGQWESCKDRRRMPDALLVSDDIATRGLTRALVASRNEDVRRLFVATVANEGIEHPYGMPVARYEYSPRGIARALLDILWRRMRHEDLSDLPVRILGKIRTAGRGRTTTVSEGEA